MLSVISIGPNVYAAVRRGQGNTSIFVFDDQLGLREELFVLPGSGAYILWSSGDSLLVNVGNHLILFEGGEGRVVLETKPGNLFWHAVGVEGRVFVQEYGEPPTSIYVSEDLARWTGLVDNVSIDKSSRHFHYIGYDSYRGWLIATLGDGNIIRVVYSP